MCFVLFDYQYVVSGKVCEIYCVDDEYLLLVVSDWILVYDYVLDSIILDKGCVLIVMSVFFFGFVDVFNYLVGLLDDLCIFDEVLGCVLVVCWLEMLLVECVVCGYLIGLGLLDYQVIGKVCGIVLLLGLVEVSWFVILLFILVIKVVLGDYDENILFDWVVEMVGVLCVNQLCDCILQMYVQVVDYVFICGIIIVDIKFEFGIDCYGNLLLVDEIFILDLLWYWFVDDYWVGVVQISFDKQFVCSWFIGFEFGWDRGSDWLLFLFFEYIVEVMCVCYINVYEWIFELKFDDWIGFGV